MRSYSLLRARDKFGGADLERLQTSETLWDASQSSGKNLYVVWLDA